LKEAFVVLDARRVDRSSILVAAGPASTDRAHNLMGHVSHAPE